MVDDDWLIFVGLRLLRASRLFLLVVSHVALRWVDTEEKKVGFTRKLSR